ncbi:hypothetical protein [Paracoccus sp. SSK6]
MDADLDRPGGAVKPVRGFFRIPLFNPPRLGYHPPHCPDAVVAELVDAQR